MIFNEDTRVKLPATIQFLRIGYNFQDIHKGNIDFNTKIFINRFKPAIEKINNAEFSDDEIMDLLSKIHTSIRNNDLGKDFYNWLINPQDKVKLIDFDNINNNDFAVVDELPYCIIEGTEEGSFRPDINILINGMPLGFLEVKKPNNEGGIQMEFNRMINKRLENPNYKKFFNLIQFVSFSNNMEYEDADDAEDVKAGSFYTTPNGTNTSFSFFREDDENYHRNYPLLNIDEETIKHVVKCCEYDFSQVDSVEFRTNLNPNSPCNSFITSVFDKERFLYFIRYGMMYLQGKNIQKHIMRYPQFFATRKIVERIDNGGKGGIIWHTQGSGKTALAAFSNIVLKEYYAQKGVNARFFFVVDRLDLLMQASEEFKARGFNVVNCKNKSEFTKELNKSLSTNISKDAVGEMCVVNIQKFEAEIPEAKNDYNTNVQRIFFVDEAHRSYAKNGEFFKNLMTCDMDAIYIALTGTPLLSKKERSNLKFGDYIHKYFYDKSIADGYTLRIKKENIDTVARSEIKKNLQIEDGQLDSKDVFESDDYINGVCPFIEKDFENFRLVNSDNSIGGMVVCRTNPQAKKIYQWFKEHSKLNVGLVISDDSDPKQGEINKTNQTDFKNSDKPDMLIVNMMLTTGYDVKRLKKMYLLRGPHAQTLLQTISRVNRPYKSPNGKIYKYGYICDFVDIEEEYDRTVEAYLHELEEDMNDTGENEGSLSGLVVDKEDINKKYLKYREDLDDIIDIDNIEKFSKRLTNFNKDTLLKIKRLLNGIKDCRIEFLLSRATEYANKIDDIKLKQLLRSVQERIDFVNLSSQTVRMMDIISNDEVVDILYEFFKTKIYILDLSKFSPDAPEVKQITDIVGQIQGEIKNNKNKDDIKVKNLDEILKKIFDKLAISDLSDLDAISEELLNVLQEVRRINDENERISKIYGGSYAFVKTYQDAIIKYDIDKSDMERVLGVIHEEIRDILDNDTILIQGRDNFVGTVKKGATKNLLKNKLYVKVKPFYDQILYELYTNLRLFK